MSQTTGCCGPSTSAPDAVAADAAREAVRDAYAKVARADTAGEATGTATGCCGVSDDDGINTLISTRLGYAQADLDLVPAGADMG
ncbi:MAG: arsenite methyltransferase, partial [Myxococcota bacterium]